MRKYKIIYDDDLCYQNEIYDGHLAVSPNGKVVWLCPTNSYWRGHVGGNIPHYVIEVRGVKPPHRKYREICWVCDVEN